MGIVAGICAPLACCFSQNACKLCCGSCPGCKYSTSTRLAYSLILAVAAICSYICTTNSFANLLIKIGPLCSYYNTTVCKDFVGYEAVYRVQLSVSIFFFAMCLIMINVRNSQDVRAFYHNGFWFFKVVPIIAIVAGISCIPKSYDFSVGVMAVGIICSFVFILIQLILIIDFAHSWNESWLEKGEEDRSWLGGLLTCTILMACLSISTIVCMYVYLTSSTSDSCNLQKTIISVHLITSVALYVISILPQIQEVQSRSGLLQSSCICLYTTYLILSALGLQESSCNRMISSANSSNSFVQFSGILSLLLTLAMLTYSTFRNAEHGALLGLSAPQEPSSLMYGGAGSSENSERYGQNVHDDEEECVTYNYSLFHFLMCMASMYLMMTITNWYNSTQPVKQTSSIAAVWVKITSSWCCQLLYLWTLIAPLVIKNRDFS